MFNSNKISLKGFCVWLVAALFFTYEFSIRTGLGTFETALRTDLHLDIVHFAVISTTAYVIIYGLMQIPAGIIIDRFGLKKSLTCASLICSLSVLAFSLTSTFITSLLCRVFMGFASSFGFIALLVVVYEWLPRKNIAFFIGLSQFIGTLGPIIAAGPLLDLAMKHNINWRSVLFYLGLLGLLLSLVILITVKNNTNTSQSVKAYKYNNVTKSNLRFLSNRQVWFISLYSGMIYFFLEYLSENSGKIFLMLKGFSELHASYLITAAWIGYALGCPLLGFLSDKFKKRKRFMIIASLTALCSMTAITYLSYNETSAFLLLFLLGLGASGQSLGFTTMAEYCSKTYVAAGLGLNNAMISAVVAINAPLIGWLIKFNQKEHLAASLLNYQIAFSVIIVTIFISTIISLFFIPET